MPTSPKPRNNWQRKRAIRGLKNHKADSADALMTLLRDLIASALQRAGLTATIAHDVQYQLVKLTNIKHTKAHAPDSGEYGLLVHYTPKGLHVVVFSQAAPSQPMRLIFSKSGALSAILSELYSWKKRTSQAATIPAATYRVVAEQLRNLAAANPHLLP